MYRTRALQRCLQKSRKSGHQQTLPISRGNNLLAQEWFLLSSGTGINHRKLGYWGAAELVDTTKGMFLLGEIIINVSLGNKILNKMNSFKVMCHSQKYVILTPDFLSLATKGENKL